MIIFFLQLCSLCIQINLVAPLLQKQQQTDVTFIYHRTCIQTPVRRVYTHTDHFSISASASSNRTLVNSHTHKSTKKVKWHISRGLLMKWVPASSNECAYLTTLTSHSSSAAHQVGHDGTHSQTFYSYLLRRWSKHQETAALPAERM